MDVLRTVGAALQKNLAEELDERARECKVVLREREFTGRTLLLLLVVTLLHKPDATWADCHLTAARLGLQVTQTAIEKRFAAGQPLVDFFRKALERALQKTIAAEPSSAALLQKFTTVLSGDATTSNLPDEFADLFKGCGGSAGASRAALKLQVLWDLKTGRLVELHSAPGSASAVKSPSASAEAEAGSLLVFDLGYFDLDRFATRDATGKKFLSRLLHGTQTYTSEGKPLDLLTHLRKQTAALVDEEILLGKSAKRRCRLVAIRVAEEVANRRRQKARAKAAKKGRVATAE